MNPPPNEPLPAFGNEPVELASRTLPFSSKYSLVFADTVLTLTNLDLFWYEPVNCKYFVTPSVATCCVWSPITFET